MRAEIGWLRDALALKGIAQEMQYYRIQDGEIRATDGRITAGYPWPHGGEFLVPGKELERVLGRLTGDINITPGKEGDVVLKSGKFKGTIHTLPLEQWAYQGVDDAAWKPIPKDLMPMVRDLRPLVSENATQAWSTGIALDDGWVYTTNNIVLGGGKCKGLKGITAILPVWAIDFVLARTEGLTHWAWSENFVAFKWEAGGWMRSQLIDGAFPERARQLVRASAEEKPTQEITPAFREAFGRIGELAEGTVSIYADHLAGGFGQALVEEEVESETPDTPAKVSLWGSKFLAPVLALSTHWSPHMWPKPTPWRGERITGYIVGQSR